MLNSVSSWLVLHAGLVVLFRHDVAVQAFVPPHRPKTTEEVNPIPFVADPLVQDNRRLVVANETENVSDNITDVLPKPSAPFSPSPSPSPSPRFAPPSAPSTAFVEAVILDFTIQGVDYDLLAEDVELVDSFKQNVRASIAREAGAPITAENVQVKLSEGSVAVVVSILPPPGLTTDTTATTLRSSSTLLDTIVEQVSAVPGIEQVVIGSISAASLKIDVTFVSLTGDSNETAWDIVRLNHTWNRTWDKSSTGTTTTLPVAGSSGFEVMRFNDSNSSVVGVSGFDFLVQFSLVLYMNDSVANLRDDEPFMEAMERAGARLAGLSVNHTEYVEVDLAEGRRLSDALVESHAHGRRLAAGAVTVKFLVSIPWELASEILFYSTTYQDVLTILSEEIAQAEAESGSAYGEWTLNADSVATMLMTIEEAFLAAGIWTLAPTPATNATVGNETNTTTLPDAPQPTFWQQVASCDSYSCPMGYAARLNASYIPCGSFMCTSEDLLICCEGLCGNYTCPASFLPKVDADHYGCSSDPCTVNDTTSCCDEILSFRGSMSFQAVGLSSMQVETAAREVLASEFGVNDSDIAVTSVLSQTFRPDFPQRDASQGCLAGIWTLEFVVTLIWPYVQSFVLRAQRFCDNKNYLDEVGLSIALKRELMMMSVKPTQLLGSWTGTQWSYPNGDFKISHCSAPQRVFGVLPPAAPGSSTRIQEARASGIKGARGDFLRELQVVAGETGVRGGPALAGHAGDQHAASLSRLAQPSDMVMDGEGRRLWVADTANHVVRLITLDAPEGLVISVYAGTLGTAGMSGDDGQATSAKLRSPYGLALDHLKQWLFVSDHGNHAVRLVSVEFGVMFTVAGTIGVPGASGDGGEAKLAKLRFPKGLATDPTNERVYVADYGNHAIRMFSLSNGLITTVAGVLGNYGTAGDGGAALSAYMRFPGGLAFDRAAQKLYVSDSGNHAVRLVDLAIGTTLTVLGVLGVVGSAGDGTEVGGQATAAMLRNPSGIALDLNRQRLYAAETGNPAVLRVDLASGLVSTAITRTGLGFGTPALPRAFAGGEPDAPDAGPAGLLYDAGTKSMYMSEAYLHVVRRADATPDQHCVGGIGPDRRS